MRNEIKIDITVFSNRLSKSGYKEIIPHLHEAYVLGTPLPMKKAMHVFILLKDRIYPYLRRLLLETTQLSK